MLPPDAVDVLDPGPEPLWVFAYVSRPTVQFTESDLGRLHLSAQTFNAQLALTGRLIVVERRHQVVRFVQFLEGPRDELDACVARIQADPRHDSITVIRHSRLASRQFAQWSMYYETQAVGALGSDVTTAIRQAGPEHREVLAA